jgi:hypothetical protein
MAAIRSTYLTDEGFTPENAKRASPAAEGLCKWVHAMSKYDKVWVWVVDGIKLAVVVVVHDTVLHAQPAGE